MLKELFSKKEGLINEFIDEALAFNKKHNIVIRANKEEVLEKDILDCMPLVERIKTKEKKVFSSLFKSIISFKIF